MAVALHNKVSLWILDRRLFSWAPTGTRWQPLSTRTLVFLRRQALQATAICCRLALPLVGDSSLAEPELPLVLEALPRERPSMSRAYAQKSRRQAEVRDPENDPR
jgi:hypothetical protein